MFLRMKLLKDVWEQLDIWVKLFLMKKLYPTQAYFYDLSKQTKKSSTNAGVITYINELKG